MRAKTNHNHPVFAVLLIVLAGGLIGLGFLVRSRVAASQSDTRTDDPGLAITPVRVATVNRWKEPRRADFHGFLLPFLELAVSARVPGQIVEQWVEISDDVTEDQPLFKVDDALLSIEHQRAQATAARAESEVDLALANWNRIKSLPEQSSSSMELIRAQQQLKSAQADQRRAATAVEEAALLLERAITPSPISGVVSAILFRQGEFVQPGQPLVQVIELDRLKLLAEVEDRDVVWVKANMPVMLTTGALPGEEFSASVGRVYPKSRSSSRKFEIEIELPNKDRRLRPGFFVQGSITSPAENSATSLLVIPREAVVQQFGRHFCYLATQANDQSQRHGVMQARRSPVQVLPIPSNPRHFQLVSGAAEGDLVITKGITHLADESLVRLTD